MLRGRFNPCIENSFWLESFLQCLSLSVLSIGLSDNRGIPLTHRGGGMLKHYQIVNGKLAESGPAGAPLTVYLSPSDEEKRQIAELFCMHPHTIDSALDPNELGRIEFEDDHVALIVKRPKRYCTEDKFLLKIISLGIFIFPQKLLIISEEESGLFEGRVLTKITTHVDLVLKLIYACILHFEGHLQTIQMISDELEREVNKAMENRHLLHLFTLEKSLVYYLNAINSNGKVIHRIKNNAAKLSLTPDECELVDDVIIENNQCYEQANTYSQVLSSLMDARASIVNNNLNIIMRTLTLVMIGIMIPTMVLGVFSINVRMPFPQHETSLPFWVILGLATASAGLVFFFVQRFKKW